MKSKTYLSAVLLMAVPVFPQAISPVNPAPFQGEDQMATPPPVSGEAYPTAVGAEVRSNYLRAGMTFVTAYIDNLYPGYEHPVAETTYSVLPTFDLDRSTSRRHASISYSPGFTFYQPTSALNEVDENATVAYLVRLSPHSTIHLDDGFRYSSTSFSPVGAGTGGMISGSAPTMTPGIIVPFAKQLTNYGHGEFELQTSRSSMIGASGIATLLHYPNQSEVTGLYDSSSRGGSAFYSCRIFRNQYLGAKYDYALVLAYPANAESDTSLQSASAFYTIYPRRSLSLSVLAGPQYYRVTETHLLRASSWSPSVAASVGWQGRHTNFASSYSQAVTAGDGLLGAFRSRNADAMVRWQISHPWIVGAGADYAINKTVSPLIFSGFLSGHGISGLATLTRSIGPQLSATLEYDRLHETYGGIAAITRNPISDRASISVSWRLTRSLGQ